MTPDDVRQRHAEAWNRLFDLVRQRNRLLGQLGTTAELAADFSPATSMYIDFDYDEARDILAKAQGMEPAIYAAVEEVNGYAVQIAKPIIQRKTLN